MPCFESREWDLETSEVEKTRDACFPSGLCSGAPWRVF